MSFRKYQKYTIAIVLIFVFLIGYFIFKQYNNSLEYISSTNGRLETTRIDVATLYPGKVENVFINEGQNINKNDEVAKIKSTDTQAQLYIAEAAKNRAAEAKERAFSEYNAKKQAVIIAELDYRNAQKLKKENLISNTELEKRKAQFLASKAALSAVSAATNEANAAINEAQANINRVQTVLDDLIIRAPITGILEYKLVEPGTILPSGGRIATILDPNDIHMNLYLPISTIAKIKINDEARIVLDGIDAVFPAQITFIDSQAQFTPKFVETHKEREKLMYKIKITIPNKIAIQYRGLLKAGLTGNAYVLTDNKKTWPAFLQSKLP